MNNQFFGDERDFFKYALLRILAACGLPVGVCWLLTEGCRNGGGKLAYLRSGKLRHLDPELFQFLSDCVCVKGERDIRVLEESGIIPDANFFSRVFPCENGRSEYFDAMVACFSDRDLVFFDPDIGMLLPNQKPSRRGAEDEYVSCDELHFVGKRLESSLVLFQFMPRGREQAMARHKQIMEILRGIGGENAEVASLWRWPVAYYFVIRPRNKREMLKGIERARIVLGLDSGNDFIGG